MSFNKIDTHQHFFPKVYVDAVGMDVLAAQMPNKRAPEWSPDKAIAMMDAAGIAEGILSVSSVPMTDRQGTIARGCNDAAADLRQKYPGRFGAFASLPLPDMDASLAEAAYALDTLKADGFIVFTSYEGAYLGDERFTPLWDELDRRGVVVLIHPNEPSYSLPRVAPASVLEFPFETTRTATSLIIAGVLSRFPGIRFILSHAGGALPFLFPRIALSLQMMPGVIDRIGDPAKAFRAFYYDTALAAGAATFAALAQVADPGRIVFGTDFPMAPDFGLDTFSAALEAMDVTGLSRPAIYRQNAARLLGRTP
ncbi:amidohydrolase family protein [Xanthomonas sp. 4461]|uniref:amidohydrolase family protein n=1 Tax=Xanthomonas sp. 4461 TaxID=3035313 RepID=UPI0021697F70|nr:amidohydrolase family protein [Xanthomonas sp. 4461]MCS3810095.1 putative TIM-barrel fold metal-dependent hydrolase [Xanthomonas sp. 4461]